MTDHLSDFLKLLDQFITTTQNLPRFRGQTQAVRALSRIKNMAAFK